MATLKANGRELLRISREYDTPNDTSVSWRRVTAVYFANGSVLKKDDARFRPTQSWDPPEGRLYSWGWKKVVLAKDNPQPVDGALRILKQVSTFPVAVEWKIEFKAAELDKR